ncbi:MAG: RNase A-like domain-containing protein [Dehalococcoidia bacterium]
MPSRLRVLIPIVVALAVLAVGIWLTSALETGGGGNDDALVAAEQTAAREDAEGTPTSAPGATRTPARTPTPGLTATATRPGATATRSAATATRTPTAASGVRRDLEADEARGGHTLSRHVGRTDDELRDRLRREPDISAASTYTNQDIAERAVGQAIRDDRTKITSWEKSASHPNLVLRVTMSTTVGRSIRQGSSTAKDVKSAVVVLKWAGSGWYVLTSYPEDR